MENNKGQWNNQNEPTSNWNRTTARGNLTAQTTKGTTKQRKLSNRTNGWSNGT
jgi:hypothetical protein